MLTIIPDILDHTELRDLRRLIDGSGFTDGKKTAGFRAKRVKNNMQLDSQDEASAKEAKNLVSQALWRNAEFKRFAKPKRLRPLLISSYAQGMTYGSHVDDALMGPIENRMRSDFSVTVFLNHPDEYEGGELTIELPLGEQQVCLPAGSAVVYPSSSLHRVNPVTSGQRLAAVTWGESYVRDPARREALYDLDQVCRFLHDKMPEARETDLAFKTLANLQRMWADT